MLSDRGGEQFASEERQVVEAMLHASQHRGLGGTVTDDHDAATSRAAVTLRHVLLGAATSAAFLPLTGRDAKAQCVPDPAPSGATVVCTGSDPDGFSTNDEPMDIIIQPGARLEGDGLAT